MYRKQTKTSRRGAGLDFQVDGQSFRVVEGVDCTVYCGRPVVEVPVLDSVREVRSKDVNVCPERRGFRV